MEPTTRNGSRSPHKEEPSIAAPNFDSSSPAKVPSLSALRPKAAEVRKLASVSLPNLRHSNILLPLRPAVEREKLRPASFPNIKAFRLAPVETPRPALQPQRLLTAEALANRPAKAAAAKPVAARLVQPQPAKAPERPAGASLPPLPLEPHRRAEPILPVSPVHRPQPRIQPRSTIRPENEPLWHTLFTPESTRPRKAEAPKRSTEQIWRDRLRESGRDWGAAGEIEAPNLRESKPPPPVEPAESSKKRQHVWFWQAVEGLFLSKTFARSVAAVTVLLLISTFDVPWRQWLGEQAGRLREPIAAMANQLSRPIQERAAFFIVDDFTRGVDHWMSDRALNVDPAGWLTVQEGLALHGGTTDLESYRFDFDAKIQSRAVGWVVRAPDRDNYYGFKLTQSGSTSSPNYSLSRFSLIEGVKSVAAQAIEVPSNLARDNDFNRISVRVIDDQITTLINGWGIDYWRDDRLDHGGVGLLADSGESALVRKMTVAGNDDTWGLILYGTLESIRSVQDFLSSELGGAAPAVIVFFQPMQGVSVNRIGGPAGFLLQGAS